MPPPLYANPFPALHLSLQEKEQLRKTAAKLINAAQQLNERYLWQENDSIDVARWFPVRQREDMRVFHDRRPGGGTMDENMHMVLTEGTVLGTVHDAMYGVLNHSTDDIRVKTAYVRDTLLDCAVLEALTEPSVEKPFESMTVRWFVKGIPLLVRLLSKQVDNVYLEATGSKDLSNGERIGYQLMHSVGFDRTPHLPQYARVNSSMCTLWRQKTPDRVQAFMTSFIEIRDKFLVPFFIRSLADALISLWKMVDYAQRKKLAWLVQSRTGVSTDSSHKNVAGHGCSVCGKNAASTMRGLKSACAICGAHTCSKCHLKNRLAIFAPDRQLLPHKMRFCLRCVTDATRLDAAVCARDEASAYEVGSGGRAPHGGFRASSVGTLSSSSARVSEEVYCLDRPVDRNLVHGCDATEVSTSSTRSLSDSRVSPP